jgi:hypothetical protein
MLAPTISGLIRIGGIWYVTAGAGVQYESGIRLRGNGVLTAVDEKFRQTLGPTAEIGVLAINRVHGANVGLDLALRHTVLSYTPNATGKAINANSTAIVLGFDFYL